MVTNSIFKRPLSEGSGEVFARIQPYAETLIQIFNTIPFGLGEHRYVGGGCLRDMVLGKEIKDFDVFVHISPEVFDKHLSAWCAGLSPEFAGINLENTGLVSVGTYDPTDSEGAMRALGVIEGTIPGVDAPVQVVFLDNARFPSLEAGLLDFDFGICQVATDPFGNVYFTDAFLNDMAYSTITLIRPATNPAEQRRAARRAARFSEKFPSYRVVLPFQETLQ
jgi:hypothetical protein